MFEGLFNVKYVSFKTSFVYLSPAHSQINTGNYIKLNYQDSETKATRKAFFSVTILNSLELEEIGINSVCARALNISEKTYIHVSVVENLPVINSLSIKPKNQNDYEVLDILSKNVQSSLLDQVRVVNTQQPLIIWIGNSISVTVVVDDVRPISPGVLDFLTELTIKNPDDISVASTSATSAGKKPKLEDTPGEMEANFVKYIKENPHKTNIENIYAFLFSDQGFPFRVVPMNKVPLKYLDKEKVSKAINTYTVFVMWQTKDFDEGGIFSLTALNSSHIRHTIYVKVALLKEFRNDDCQSEILTKENQHDIIVPTNSLRALDLEFGSRVVLKKVKTANPVVFEIEIRCKKQYLHNIVEKFKAFIEEHIQDESLLLNANVPFNLAENIWVSLKFLPGSSDFCVLNKDIVKSCKFTPVEDDTMKPLPVEPDKEDDKELMALETKLPRTPNEFKVAFLTGTNMILVGKSGTGKSKLLERLSIIGQKMVKHWYSAMIHCKQLKGRTVESLQKIFSDVAQKLVSCQPSVLFLDDLQVLCEHCEGDDTPNSVYHNRVSEMIFNMLVQLTTGNAIFIVAAVESIHKLNRQIHTSRGNHFFKNVINIEQLNKADRMLLLKHYFQKRKTENLDFQDLATKMEGFVIQDVVDFYIKAVYEAHKQEKDPTKIPVVTRQHCEVALQKTTPLSLQNVKFSESLSKSFSDIGGLQDVKNVLIESLLWPSQYPQIFCGAPLRLQSGILLYGAPGTGKTLLAGAAAKYCDLRLISVKGPELLSKYIGASEQAVRDIFERAQNAKPCILFFDEFDSLAPRRGHDSTGVTDRVVNQLLTHLDGIEALTEVYVLAATSRPDLLDPALLRPGRLDKQLLCSIPDEKERMEILQIMSKGLDLDDDVDFQALARLTDGYTGADLQSVMYTAQMSIVTDMEVDAPNLRDDTIVGMKARFCPNTPKTFLSRRAKVQLLERTNNDIYRYCRAEGRIFVVVVEENQRMRMVSVRVNQPMDIREFLSMNVAFEPDTPIEIYDFNNWNQNEPHYAVFVGNCNTGLNLEKIDQQCLVDAINRTRCSLPLTEKLRYDKIYKQFQGGKMEDFQAGSKVTLA